MDGDGRTTANLSTQQILSTWKKLVTQDISEQYFSSHFDVVEVNIQPPNTWVGSGDVAAAITYKFKFDWAKTHGPTNPDGRSLPDFVYLGTMTAKTSLEDGTYIDWTFTPYNDAEMKQKFEERRNQQHNMRTGLGAGYTSATEQEIKSIIPEANATALLQTCNKNMSINGIELTSTGKDLQFIAYGTVDSDTENCEGHPDNTHTVTSGMVNLVTGETACRTEKASCAKYSAKAKAAANERTNAPPSATPAQQPGFFKRVANWFKNLF
jgi:hypothetical protein